MLCSGGALVALIAVVAGKLVPGGRTTKSLESELQQQLQRDNDDYMEKVHLDNLLNKVPKHNETDRRAYDLAVPWGDSERESSVNYNDTFNAMTYTPSMRARTAEDTYNQSRAGPAPNKRPVEAKRQPLEETYKPPLEATRQPLEATYKPPLEAERQPLEETYKQTLEAKRQSLEETYKQPLEAKRQSLEETYKQPLEAKRQSLEETYKQPLEAKRQSLEETYKQPLEAKRQSLEETYKQPLEAKRQPLEATNKQQPEAKRLQRIQKLKKFLNRNMDLLGDVVDIRKLKQLTAGPSPIPLASSPIPLASSPTPLASSPIPLASSPIPLASSPIPLAPSPTPIPPSLMFRAHDNPVPPSVITEPPRVSKKTHTQKHTTTINYIINDLKEKIRTLLMEAPAPSKASRPFKPEAITGQVFRPREAVAPVVLRSDDREEPKHYIDNDLGNRHTRLPDLRRTKERALRDEGRYFGIRAGRAYAAKLRQDEKKHAHPPTPRVSTTRDARDLDLAVALGGRVSALRSRGRICQRSVLVPEGPKYDSKGKVYLKAFDPPKNSHMDYARTRIPDLVLPKCCNCCKKSVLGCE